MSSRDGALLPSVWASHSRPDLGGSAPLRLGALGARRSLGSLEVHFPAGARPRRPACLGVVSPGKGLLSGCGVYDTAEDGCIRVASHVPSRKYPPLYDPLQPSFILPPLPPAQTGLQLRGGDSVNKLEMRVCTCVCSHPVRTQLRGLSCNFLFQVPSRGSIPVVSNLGSF